MSSPAEESPSTVTWRPHVQPVGNVPRPGSGLLEPVTKTSLAHNQPPSMPIGTAHNAAPKPFAGPTLVHKQFNSPINLYSNKNIAETIQAHSELLAPGVVGINFMKADAPVNKESAVYKAILEEEAARNQNRTGGVPFGSHYQQPAHNVNPLNQANQSSSQITQPNTREDLRASPTLQSHSFRRLQQVLGDSDEPASATRHVEPPTNRAPVASNQTVEQNVCSECGRLIVGIFCKIKDRKLHEECFRCSTCGNSLKNQGYFNINEKLYCELHAQQAARTGTHPSRIVQPNSTAIRPHVSKPLSPLPTQSPTLASHYAKPASPIVSPRQDTTASSKLIAQNRVASPLSTSTNSSSANTTTLLKTYNNNLYQSTPLPYPGPKADSYRQPATVSAPKFNWPQTTSSCTSETIQLPDGGVAKVRSETVQSSYSTGPVYSGNSVTNSYQSTYSNAQQIQQLSNKLDNTKLSDITNKVPPRTLPKPQLNTWNKPAVGSVGTGGINQSHSFRQQTTTTTSTAGLGHPISTGSTVNNYTSGQSSMTGSRPAPRRGRGQLQTLDQGGRQPICASLACGQQIRGPFIAALNRTWCPDHFVCAHSACRRPLQDCGFVEEKGNLYCENCFELHFAPTCTKCGQRIKGDCLIALDKQYHPQCFVCSYCKKVFANTSFYLEDGLPYCEQDWNELFTTKCIACALPIEAGDRWVEALNNNYHSQCFRCTVCARNLEGESFYAKGGKPYCKAH